MKNENFNLIKEFIYKLLYETINNNNITIKNNTLLNEELGLESLDLIYICMKIEENYEISIEDTIVNSWTTVEDLITTTTKSLNKLV